MNNDVLVSIGIALLVVWSLIWKGVALWKSARNNQVGWFTALMLINAAGILEIIYISFFSKEKRSLR